MRATIFFITMEFKLLDVNGNTIVRLGKACVPLGNCQEILMSNLDDMGHVELANNLGKNI